MSSPICWSRAEIQLATQVDVGGLEVGEPVADAIFLAIHQSVPIGRLRKAGATEAVSVVGEMDVLADFDRQLTSNEPHLLFITGRAGTGKSHLVRWLRSALGDRPERHIVYVEKRNTSLRRVIEQILAGIDSPKATELRQALAQASSELSSPGEAMLALLAKLEQLVRYDSAAAVGGIHGAPLADLREKAGRLIGDYTFRERLSVPGGPVERITRLAMDGTDVGQDIDESDLHLSADDLLVDTEDFEDAGAGLLKLIGSMVNNDRMRSDLASLLDHYLARAKAEVFTGRSADLLDVFEEVRREVAGRGKELCLFVEDLVLLHGIDTQLAQALTVPARSDLCRIRAVIAVTSGYLRDVTTFAERGVHYTMDVERAQVGPAPLRSMIGRYLNAGRVGGLALAEARAVSSDSPVPNKCDSCEFRSRCHSAFGQSVEGHGLYPFNAWAIDRLVQLASPTDFDPRTILREVIRGPLEVAEGELGESGRFPSARFAASLDQHRSNVRVEVREAVRGASANPEAELSLRAFYSQTPPLDDDDVRRAAAYLGVTLCEVEVAEPDTTGQSGEKTSAPPATQSTVDRWVTGARLPQDVATRIRSWVLDTVATRLQSGPHGLTVRKTGKRGEWQVGRLPVRLGDVRIENAGGGGALESEVSISFVSNDADAVLLKGILQAASGEGLAGPDQGQWFFALQVRLSRFEAEIVAAAQRDVSADLAGALAILGVQRRLAEAVGADAGDGLSAMFRSTPSTGLHPAASTFARETKGQRDRALAVLRDRVTTAKGGGAPSVFDAGAVSRELRTAVSLRQLQEPYVGSEDMVRALQAVHQRQGTAARAVWSDVRAELTQLESVVASDEDLMAAMDAVDKLIDAAHGRHLPSADSRDVYREARKAVPGDAMELYRRLARRADQEIEPDALWDVARDPLPRLRALREYAALTGRLLTSVESRLAATTDGSTDGDRSRLDAAFGSLVEHLDELDRQV